MPGTLLGVRKYQQLRVRVFTWPWDELIIINEYLGWIQGLEGKMKSIKGSRTSVLGWVLLYME